MDKKLLILLLASGSLGAIISIINFLILSGIEPSLSSSIYMFAAFIAIFPVIILKYSEYKKIKNIEEMFPVFLRDFVEAIRGGMPVPQAFKSVSANDYKSLSPYVKKMTAQLDWGISVEKVLLNFIKEVKSKLIARIVSSVIESHRFGGNLSDTFEALSATSLEVDKLREERKLYLHSQMITGYIIFFVFLAVILGLQQFLVPSLTQVSMQTLAGGTAVSPEGMSATAEKYKEIFRNLIIIQGIFAGLAVGKMAEGSIVAGLKHSAFMAITGTVIYLLFSGMTLPTMI